MFDGQSPAARQARMRMLAMSAMALGQMMGSPEPIRPIAPLQYRNHKMITKAERSKRNVRKNIAKQSKKRNRRR
jgi:hypothetical protein